MRKAYIYKITSPSKKIYIGSTFNLKTRKNDYKYNNCKNQTKLYNSLVKYGYKNHIHEIIEECDENTRNQREYYWGMYFDVLGKNGLNLTLPKGLGNYSSCSDETKQKISLKTKGKNNPMYGKKHTPQHTLNQSNAQKGIFSREKHFLAKKVIDINTNKTWNCAKDCAEQLNIKYSTLISRLNGTNKNNSHLKYL